MTLLLSLGLFLSSVLGDTLTTLDSAAPALDLDGDGKVDTWRVFDKEGRLTEMRYDHDGDGKPDETVKREGDVLTRITTTSREREYYDSSGATKRMTRERLVAKDWKLEEERIYDLARDRVKITRYDEKGKATVSEDAATWVHRTPADDAVVIKK